MLLLNNTTSSSATAGCIVYPLMNVSFRYRYHLSGQRPLTKIELFGPDMALAASIENAQKVILQTSDRLFRSKYQINISNASRWTQLADVVHGLSKKKKS